ncbi:MAG: restriction endonuclease subunit S [Chloroflexi bacterium]|nr:restriction endonuclease subunit S [Chloroflexota bacterium]
MRLGDHCSKIGSGSTPRGGESVYQQDGVSFIRSQNVYNGRFAEQGLAHLDEEQADHLKGVTVESGDVLLNITGDSVARCCRVPDEVLPARVNQHVAIIRPKPGEFDSRFIGYFFISPFMQDTMLSLAGGGGTRKALTKEMIERFEVPRPPRPVQEAVADTLSAYDDLIENNRRRMKLLEDTARQLYREWFVRLRFPGHEHTRVTNGVPEGWERKTLGELAGITMGQSPESKHYNEDGEGLPFHQGVTDFGDRFVTHRIYSTALNRLAEPGDILCSVRAPVGRLNVTLDKIVIGRGLAALRSKSGQQSFLFQQLRTHFFKEDLIGGGTIFASVTKKEFAAQELPDPPQRLKRVFEELSVPFDEQTRLLHLQNDKLRAARDLLLPRLMNGEIAA